MYFKFRSRRLSRFCCLDYSAWQPGDARDGDSHDCPSDSFGCGGISARHFFAGAAQANIVTNPGFETGDFTGWTLSGDTTFTSLTISSLTPEASVRF